MVKLYKDSVEDKIKENVAIGGQEWDSVTRAEVSSNSAVEEGTCKLTWEAQAKRSQRFNATYRNIFGRNMLRSFNLTTMLQRVAANMLGVAGSNLNMVKFCMNICGCCMML